MKIKLTITILCCAPLLLSGQDFGSIAQNNLSGVYATLTNPANAAGGIDRFSFNLIGVSANVNNNALRTDLEYDLLRVVGRRPLRLEPGSVEKVAVQAPRNLVRKPVIYAEVDALQVAAQVAISKKWSVYAFARERAFANFDKADYSSLKYLVEEEYNHSEPRLNLGFDARSIAYQEIGVGGAFQLYEKRQHYLKAGFTYKRINARGIYAFNLPNFESKIVDSSIHVKGDISIVETALDVAKQNPLDFLLNPSMGGGHAFDVGLVYEHRPRNLKSTYRKNNLKRKNKVFNGRNLTKYDYRIGFSLNDIGTVGFNSKYVMSTTSRIQATFDPLELGRMTLEDYSQRVLDSATVTTSNDDVRFNLPSTLTISYDQRLLKNWFASFTYQQNMVGSSLSSFYQPTNLQVQLRKETRKCVYGFPAHLVPATRTFVVGAYAQTGPFFIGTHNLGTLFLKKMYNPSVYTGVLYNIRHKADRTIENHRSFKTKRKRKLIWSMM